MTELISISKKPLQSSDFTEAVNSEGRRVRPPFKNLNLKKSRSCQPSPSLSPAFIDSFLPAEAISRLKWDGKAAGRAEEFPFMGLEWAGEWTATPRSSMEAAKKMCDVMFEVLQDRCVRFHS